MAIARQGRQLKLLEIIAQQEIETQFELASALEAAGYKVTQATISRDIKELGLIKILTDEKKYKYFYVEGNNQNISAKLISLFKESVISVQGSLNMVVIRTLSGSANTAALLIDKLSMPMILGTVAGDDTILVISRSVEEVDYIVAKIKEFIR